ncbi:hypothetical protein STEG23_031445, partial [Scotinomys teguina]
TMRMSVVHVAAEGCVDIGGLWYHQRPYGGIHNKVVDLEGLQNKGKKMDANEKTKSFLTLSSEQALFLLAAIKGIKQGFHLLALTDRYL